MTIEKTKKMRALTLRLDEELWSNLKAHAQKNRVSINRFIHLTLTTSFEKKEVSFDERINVLEKKEVESRVYFTVSEADILRAYALSNGWSLSQESRYRVVSSFAKKPKLSGEELKAIYEVRSSINVLSANVNRLVRDHESLSDTSIHICQELITLLQELKNKIKYLEKCNFSNFKLKELGD